MAETLEQWQGSRAAAKVHMAVPGRDAQRSDPIQLLWRCITRRGVHHADSLHPLGRAPVKNRSRLPIVDVLLLFSSGVVVRVMDLFAHSAGRMKRLIAIVQRQVYIPITCQHFACSGHDPLGALIVTGL